MNALNYISPNKQHHVRPVTMQFNCSGMMKNQKMKKNLKVLATILSIQGIAKSCVLLSPFTALYVENNHLLKVIQDVKRFVKQQNYFTIHICILNQIQYTKKSMRILSMACK